MYRGQVSAVDGAGVYVLVPALHPTAPFGPLEHVGATPAVGARVLVVDCGGESEPDLIVLGTVPGTDGSWADWDCNFGAMTALGAGTFTSRYTRIGDTVHFRIDLTVAADTTFSGDNWAFPLPVASAVPVYAPVSAYYLDSGTSDGYLTARISDSGANIRVLSAGNYVSATVPHTWAVGDQLHIAGTYEAA